MRLCHQPAQVQAQSHATRAALARVVDAVERLGQLGQYGGLDSRPVVAHLDQDCFACMQDAQHGAAMAFAAMA